MRRWAVGLLALSLLCTATGAATPSAQLSWRPTWLAVEINGIRADDTIVVLTDDGRLWLERSFIERSRLVIADGRAAHEFLGRQYYAFNELAAAGQLSWMIDARRQILAVTADPRALRSTEISAETAVAHSNVDLQPGMFLSYDLASTSADGDSVHAGLVDLTFFRGPFSFTTTQVARRERGVDEFLRLDTTLTADFQDRRASLRMGDTTATGGQWGRAVRIGGVQWATNFGTQPDLLTLPLASIAGEAAVPSTVDVFVNGSLAASRDVGAGPFSITELPVVSGSGQVIARVRDALGREQLISQAFYASPQLLRTGLDDYSFELGKSREGYATADDNYGDLFAQGMWRRGLRAGTTGEVRLQLMEDRATGGFGLTQSLGGVGVLQAAVAASNGDDGTGLLAQAGYEYAAPRFSFGALFRWNDSRFRELADYGRNVERWDATARAGWSSPRFGSLSAALVRRETTARTTIATATYACSLAQSAYLSVTVSSDLDARETQFFAGITRLLGRNRTADLRVSGGRDGATFSGELRQNRQPGLGLAYGLQTEQGEHERLAADAEWRAGAGTVSTEVAHVAGDTGVRIVGSGALAVVGGYWAALPRIDGSFAILQVGDVPNLPVYLENQVVAYTDDHGVARIAGLRPYERNRIAIDPADVPLTTQIERSRLEVVPYGRGGVALQMGVRRSTSALLRIVNEAGQPLSAGTRVMVVDRSYPVGLDGVVFVPDLEGVASISASDNAQACSVSVDASSVRPLPEKTDLVCK